MSPTLIFWLTFAQTVISGVGALIVASVARGVKVGRWAQSIDHGPDIQQLREEMKNRFDAAGKRMSDMASLVQGLDDVYLRKDVAEMFVRESRDSRSQLRSDIDRISMEGRADRAQLHEYFNNLRSALERRSDRPSG